MKENKMFDVLDDLKEVAKSISREVKFIKADIYGNAAILCFSDEDGKEWTVEVKECEKSVSVQM